jgi:signal transduction histidine kinase
MNTSPRTILLIDPDRDRRRAVGTTLLEHDLSVLMSPDVTTAQALVRHHRPSAVLIDSSLLVIHDLREKLYIHGLHVDVPFVVLAEEREPLANTSVPYGVISRPLGEAGIRSLKAIQGLPSTSEPVYTPPPAQSQPSLLYALPHEYRTPLTDIIGWASFLHGHADTMSPAEVRLLTSDVLGAARRLLRTTDNFLVYAQIETLSDSPLHIQRMRQCTTPEPASVLYDAIISKAMAHERAADITLALDVEGVPVRIMEQHLVKITSELIDNALYFSSKGSPVVVQATPGKESVAFTIRDHGVGMREDEVPSIGPYQQFRRESQEQQGVGLGLVIAKRLVELHGGTFSVTSTLGMGTSVTFTLPRAV